MDEVSVGRTACGNCGARAATGMARLGTTRAGRAIEIAVCDDCVPAPPRAAKGRKKRPKGHMAYGDHGRRLLSIMYRLRGGTVDDLSEHLALEDPELDRRDDAGLLLCRHTVYRTLTMMREQRLVESIALPRFKKDGDVKLNFASKVRASARVGKPRNFYQLASKGQVVGASYSGEDYRRAALKGYARHGGENRIHHARRRNFILWSLADAAARSSGKVSVRHAAVWGESHPSFPLFSGLLPKTSKRRYESCEPDAYVPVCWENGLASAFFFEVETEVRTKIVADKLDRYAAHALRAHEELLPEKVSSQVRGLEMELADCEEQVRRMSGAGVTHTSELQHRMFELRAEIQEAERRRERDVDGYLGFPDAVCPVVFVLPGREQAAGMASRIKSRQHPTPRLDRLGELWKGRVDFGQLIYFTGLDDVLDEPFGAVYTTLSGLDGIKLRAAAFLRRGLMTARPMPRSR